jgi:two-component system response regulator AtoC
VLQAHSFERLGGTESIVGDFRVLAATNRDLDATVRERLFREDLFYRLNVVRITVPPLRERRADIVPLAEHFLRLYSEGNDLPAIGFSEEAILMLQTYAFPGNVRELENMVERAVLMARGRVIMPSHFPQVAASSRSSNGGHVDIDLLTLPFHMAVGELEKRLIESAIRLASGNKTEAANRLQINRRLLYQKMAEHQIKE